MIRRLAAAALLCLTAGAAQAVECRNEVFEGLEFALCEVDPAAEDLRLFLNDEDGQLLGSFDAVDKADAGSALVFAMNAGMYHRDRSPVGLYLEEGEQAMRLVTNPGPGNFGLLPNGVFCIGEGSARVIESLAYEAEAPDCRYATQSGPMLVIDGALHPRFLPDSTSRHIRNGVGTTASGDRAVFVMSNQPVTFHEFGRLFRDGLGLPQALYFDGNISRLYAPALGRRDIGFAMGPIVGVMAPLDPPGAGG
ncbi:phosphodiester glycosidase family protein [Pseudoroseicyclus aestuarii]|uniref:Uncharacterized protein YigE (DUF2233 family) n=1 Tax=Pseudoroseicyclus aestuarii TaxID=1795041 RepID=A0A318SQF9_9RHOB|nr:phosphodiester glycosidase family protein [Pseudoroseicyclus aestuarii]PYE83913.1 uncharacterized protein YigE (DUF2233 family) [Pseudoroseicyclus aestuarii]